MLPPFRQSTKTGLLLFLLFGAALIHSNVSAQLLTTIAGNGTAGFLGDGGPAKQAQLHNPIGLCFDFKGNLYISDYHNQRIRKVDVQTGIISTIAGNGTAGFSGDGGPAINSQLNNPMYMTTDGQNGLYFTDYSNLRVRRIDLVTGIITTVAGNGTENYINGALATQSGMLPMGLAFDAAGNLFISQHMPPLVSYTSNIISKVDKQTGIVTTFAGNGHFTFAGDGGPALQASFFNPMGMCFDATGNLYVADAGNLRVRKIDASTGIITTVVGGSGSRYWQNGIPAISAGLVNPLDVKIDPAGNLVVVDQSNLIISKVDQSTGLIYILAGTHYLGNSPDCAPAISNLSEPTNLAFDAAGNLCFSDLNSHRIRTIFPDVTPVVDITATDTEICPGTNISFTATNTSRSSAPSYQWYVNDNPVGTNNTTYSSSNLADGDIVTCIMTVPHCGTGTTKDVSNPITIKQLSSLNASVSITASATTVCKGVSVDFTATAKQAGNNPKYQWKINNAPVGSNDAQFSTSALSDGDVVSCTIITEANSCGPSQTVVSNKMSITVREMLQPSILVTADQEEICEGEVIRFTALAEHAGTDPKFQWQVNGVALGNDEIFIANNLKTGDQVNCILTPSACGLPTTSDAIAVRVHPIPVIHLSPADTTIAAGTAIVLKARVDAGAYQYEWMPAAQLTSTNSLQVLTLPLEQPLAFKLKVTSDKGCTAQKKGVIKVVRELYMPNAFTPNGDGRNDVFKIPQGVQLSLKQFSVFDRWGNIVFKTSDPSQGWNGSFKGMPLNTNIYIYTISGETNKGAIELKGTVLLLR